MISDEDRKLADETFGLIERSEHVQADQPAVLAETWPAGPCEHGASLTAYCAQCDDEAGDETSDLPAPVDVSLALAEHTAPALDAIENATAEDRLMYPAMKVVSLFMVDARTIADALRGATFEALIAYDPIDDAFKIRIDGRSWSPPFRGHES